MIGRITLIRGDCRAVTERKPGSGKAGERSLYGYVIEKQAQGSEEQWGIVDECGGFDDIIVADNAARKALDNAIR